MIIKELQKIVRLLETYRGHDKVLRLLTFAAMYMGGEGKTSRQVKWRTISSEISASRVILRLVDDLPMLLSNLSTGFGLKEPNPALKPLQVLTNILNQIFYPVEHISWVRSKNILKGSSVFSLLSLLIWVVTMIAELLKSAIKLHTVAVQADKLVKQEQLDRDSNNSSQNVQIKENLKKLSSEKKDIILGVVQLSCDLTNAIAWLPPGFLWSQKLSPTTNGILGTIASVIMLYRVWPTNQTERK